MGEFRLGELQIHLGLFDRQKERFAVQTQEDFACAEEVGLANGDLLDAGRNARPQVSYVPRDIGVVGRNATEVVFQPWDTVVQAGAGKKNRDCGSYDKPPPAAVAAAVCCTALRLPIFGLRRGSGGSLCAWRVPALESGDEEDIVVLSSLMTRRPESSGQTAEEARSASGLAWLGPLKGYGYSQRRSAAEEENTARRNA